METFEAIRTMLAVRSYQDRPIAPETVRRIVEAGRLTGSSRNLQPWHFIVVEDRNALRELGNRARTGPYTATAAMAIVVGVERASVYGLSDASRAIQSMMLAAWEEGIGSNWVGFNNLAEAAAYLGIPGEIEVVGVIPFGYPTAKIGKGRKNRKAIGEVAHRERWGQPFA